MAEVEESTVAAHAARLNVADRLAEFAARSPDNLAVVASGRGDRDDATITFGELDADATRIAHGLVAWGVTPGTRLALLVRPGIEFVTLVFALLRAGAVIVLADPGLGRKNLIRCLAEAEPEGFIAIPAAHAVRMFVRRRFPQAKWNVTVGRRWFWGGQTLDQIRQRGMQENPLPAPRSLLPATYADDPAAIIFTSGSTGPPKGVLYTQGMFDTQVSEIQSTYEIQPGGVDLSCFPLFALFNSAMGVTTVLPEMDFSRPASADPNKLLAAANDWKVTQAFASPAVWRNLGEHCAKTCDRIDSLRQIFSCGAPVSADVLRSALAIAAPHAKMHTPYGATECLPVATLEAAEVFDETAVRTNEGAGVCVGRKFDSIQWRIIRISDEPIASIDDAEQLPIGEIGELIVRGPQVSPRYVTRTECNAEAKISDKRAGASSPPSVWHRMGDVGYLDEQGRFWYCGRKSQRVETVDGPLFTECVEGVINSHPRVHRSALVEAVIDGESMRVVWIELNSKCRSSLDFERTLDELRHEQPYCETTRRIDAFLRRDTLPVDIRHNSKINREQLAVIASESIPSFVD